MKRYIEKIIIPFLIQKRQSLKLEETHPALAIFDGFRGQTTAVIQALLKANNIVSVLVPPNCTDKLQPLDVAVNKPMKDAMRSKFQSWYAREVQQQMKVVPLDQVKVDVGMTVIKSPSTSWIVAAWQSIGARAEITVNGFRAVGIQAAIAKVRD